MPQYEFMGKERGYIIECYAPCLGRAKRCSRNKVSLQVYLSRANRTICIYSICHDNINCSIRLGITTATAGYVCEFVRWNKNPKISLHTGERQEHPQILHSLVLKKTALLIELVGNSDHMV
eukprot:scaffold64750_cov17-Prasinocladus_malaysianus.AAC.1